TIRDAFEAALVDPATGRVVVLPYARGREAAFNVTEGLPAVAGQGSSASGGGVAFDLSGLTPGSRVKLIVRLVNNDDDTTTSVRVHCVDLATAAAAKFFVVDDAVDSTFRYDGAGGSLGNSPLLGANGAAAAPRGAASNAEGSRVWVVDASGTVWVYDGRGTPVGSWRAEDAGLTDPQGVTTEGTDIWLIDAGSLRVYRYAGAAALTGGSAAAAGSFALHADNERPSDLVTDGTKIWVTDSGSDEVFVYTLAGALVGRWGLDPLNGNASGVTIDPAGGTDLWVVDRQDLVVYRYATGRTQTSGALAATATFPLAAGQRRPEGIADPPAGGTDGAPAPTAPGTGKGTDSDIETDAVQTRSGSGGSGGSGGSIGDYVWDDADADGVQDAGETGLSDVTVNLYNGSGVLLGSDLTDSSGFYSFSGLSAGTYEVEFVPPPGYGFSPKDQGTDDSLDSDADQATGRAGPFALGSEQRTDIDAGMVLLPPPPPIPPLDYYLGMKVAH
ncbi:MAG TPA: SdrD B-like domain-containing protein, partial [Gemmataceae bacterium]